MSDQALSPASSSWWVVTACCPAGTAGTGAFWVPPSPRLTVKVTNPRANWITAGRSRRRLRPAARWRRARPGWRGRWCRSAGRARSTTASRRERIPAPPSTGTIEACAEAGPDLLAACPIAHAALGRRIDVFVDLLATKHGLAAVPRSDDAGFDTLHASFLDRLVPVCAQLLEAAAGEIRSDTDAYELMCGVGTCASTRTAIPRHAARRLVELLIADCACRASRRTYGDAVQGALCTYAERDSGCWSGPLTCHVRSPVGDAFRPDRAHTGAGASSKERQGAGGELRTQIRVLDPVRSIVEAR